MRLFSNTADESRGYANYVLTTAVFRVTIQHPCLFNNAKQNHGALPHTTLGRDSSLPKPIPLIYLKKFIVGVWGQSRPPAGFGAEPQGFLPISLGVLNSYFLGLIAEKTPEGDKSRGLF